MIFLVLQRRGRPEPGPKKGTLFDTFSLTWPITGETRDCHSELDSCPFDPTLVSAASSVTELHIRTRVGQKGPERSSKRHPRVQKLRKKVNFLAKSSGKNGVSLRTEDGRGKAAPLLAPPRSRPCLGGYNPPHSNYPRKKSKANNSYTSWYAKQSRNEKLPEIVLEDKPASPGPVAERFPMFA